MDLLKQRIGRTVMYKTVKLNKLGKGDLYLKMEGLNPTGRMQDRLAFYLIKEAIQLGYKTVVVASLGPLGQSLAFISDRFNIKCKVVMPINSIERKKSWYREHNVEIIEHGKKYIEAYHKSMELAKENNWYDANHGYDNSSLTTSVYSEIAEEIVGKLGYCPENLFCFLSNGVLVTALHTGFRTLWRKGIIERIPRLFVTCVGHDNPLYIHYRDGKGLYLDKTRINRYKGMSKNTIEYNIIDPQGVLSAVADSGGAIIPVTVAEIKEIMHTSKSLENLNVGFRGGATLCAFQYISKISKLNEDSVSLAILEEGKNEINIRQLSDDDFESLNQLAIYVDRYLGQYGDDRQASIEAIKTSFENGFILGAYISGKLKGLAVVARMPMKCVMPEYHLIYIGADITAGSRGIGTRLMEEVRIMTKGNFSLHVDLENKKAIKLYQKMGLKKAYLRMIAEKM